MTVHELIQELIELPQDLQILDTDGHPIIGAVQGDMEDAVFIEAEF